MARMVSLYTRGADVRAENEMTSNDKEGKPQGASDNPRLSTRRIYTGRVLNLDMDTVRFPNGRTGELEMIRHSGASAVLPFVSDVNGEDPQILLLKQYRYAAEDFLYEVPAGRLNSGEKPIDCARRELREETGCTADSITLMTTIYTTPGFTDERIHLFMAEGLTMGEAALEEDELIELETMPLSKALMLIRDGVICDAKSALAILYGAGYRT